MKVFITGGTGGIGKALTEHYLRDGHEVGICGGDKAAFASAFPAPPPQLFFFELDVTDRTQTRAQIAAFADGKLDVLIAAAGINDGAPVTGRPLDFDRAGKIFQVNLLGVLHSIEAALEQMLPHQQGRIAVLSSAAGMVGYAQTPAYCSAKAALITLSESLALRYHDQGISVSCLVPGYIDTPLARATHPELDRMPFLVSTEKAARIIVRSIERGVVRKVFPWQVHLISLFLQWLPRSWFRALFSWSEK